MFHHAGRQHAGAEELDLLDSRVLQEYTEPKEITNFENYLFGSSAGAAWVYHSRDSFQNHALHHSL